MQLDFTADQEQLRENVRAVLAKECPPSVVRDLVEHGAPPDALWKQMVALDWPALTVAEEHGGIGYGFVELAVLAEELGRVAAGGPLAPTVTQLVPVIRETATDAEAADILGRVARGELRGTIAVADGVGSWDPTRIELTAQAAGTDGWLLSGEKRYVMEPTGVDEIAVVARAGNGLGVFLVLASAVTAEVLWSADPTRATGTVHLDDVMVPAERSFSPGTAEAGVARALEEATVAQALDCVGACQWLFDTTLEYARQREQFGVPIGSFQAIKHKLADCMVALERARSTCYFAAAAIAEDDERRSVAASMAKATAGDCQRKIAREAIQIHGGIGYMWENDVQLWAKRAMAGDMVLGTAAEHRQRVARHLGV